MLRPYEKANRLCDCTMFKGMIGVVKETFPNAEVFATTLRQVVNVNDIRCRDGT